MLECLLVDLHSMHDGLEEIDPEISPRNSLGCGSVDWLAIEGSMKNSWKRWGFGFIDRATFGWSSDLLATEGSIEPSQEDSWLLKTMKFGVYWPSNLRSIKWLSKCEKVSVTDGATEGPSIDRRNSINKSWVTKRMTKELRLNWGCDWRPFDGSSAPFGWSKPLDPYIIKGFFGGAKCTLKYWSSSTDEQGRY